MFIPKSSILSLVTFEVISALEVTLIRSSTNRNQYMIESQETQAKHFHLSVNFSLLIESMQPPRKAESIITLFRFLVAFICQDCLFL